MPKYTLEVSHQDAKLDAVIDQVYYDLTSDRTEAVLATFPGITLEDYSHEEGWYIYSTADANQLINVNIQGERYV